MANIEIDEKRRIADLVLTSDVKTLLSPEFENTLSRFDNSITNVKETFQEMNTAIDKTKEIVDNVSILWNCTL